MQTRTGRALLASLALVANLVATSVPVLHAWAHELADSHHTHSRVVQGEEHSHEKVHPEALHADCLLVQRVALDLALGLPMQPPDLVTFITEATLSLHPVAPMPSRAPPSPGQARAPPKV